MKIIEWCNNNEGFAMIILSIGTLLVSIIAVIISIRTSKLPFKKKLLIETDSYFGVGIDTTGVHITATNIENRNIRVKNIGLLINKQVYTNINSVSESKITLSMGDSTTQYFDNKDLKQLKKLNRNTKIYGFVEDTEVKKYKKICAKLKG